MLSTYKIFDQVLNEIDGVFSGKSYLNPTKAVYSSNYHQYRWHENEKEYKLEMAIPGLTKNDLSVSVEDDVVKLEIKTKNSFVSPFQTNRVLPENVNVDEMTARVENGILILTLPKNVPPPKKTRLIAVK